jgi:ABC-type dipeptide/oligopeptide/nickel transport system permease subunit
MGRNAMVLSGAILLTGFAAVALLSVVYTPHDPRRDVNLAERYRPPELFQPGAGVARGRAPYVLGTDGLGRCVLSRVMAGARVSLRVGILVVSAAIVVGAAMGTVAAYYGGAADGVLMRVVDVLLALPGILLALVIVSILGPSLQNAMIAVAIVSVPQYARVMRAEVLRVRAQEFVTAARALGATDWRILRRAILPNCLAPLLVQATLGMGTAILETAGLSYLGLGDEPSTPEWGRMIAEEFRYIRQASWAVLPPLVSISLVVLGFNLLGDGLRDVLDPRLRSARDA